MGRDQSENEQLFHKAEGTLRINAVHQGQAAVGTDALMFLSGPVGAAIRVTAFAGGYKMGVGSRQLVNGEWREGSRQCYYGRLNGCRYGCY